MPLAPKVHTFQAEVRRDQSLVPSRKPQNGTVVADALPGTFTARSRSTSNALDQQFFAKRHSKFPWDKAASANIRDRTKAN